MPCSGHRTGTAQRTHSRGYSIRPVPVLAPPSAFDPIHPDFCSPTSRKTRARRDWKKKRSPFRSLAGHRLCAAATVAPALFPNLAPTRFPVLVLGRIFVVAPLHPRLFFSLFQLQSSTRSKRDVALQPLLPWRPPRPQRRLCRTRPLVPRRRRAPANLTKLQPPPFASPLPSRRLSRKHLLLLPPMLQVQPRQLQLRIQHRRRRQGQHQHLQSQSIPSRPSLPPSTSPWGRPPQTPRIASIPSTRWLPTRSRPFKSRSKRCPCRSAA